MLFGVCFVFGGGYICWLLWVAGGDLVSWLFAGDGVAKVRLLSLPSDRRVSSHYSCECGASSCGVCHFVFGQLC